MSKWASWEAIVPKYVEPIPFGTARLLFQHLIQLCILIFENDGFSGSPILLVGLPGTAKTVTCGITSFFTRKEYLLNNVSVERVGLKLDPQGDAMIKVSKIYGPQMGKTTLFY